jgi:very-short-patch-repair endonuclease
LANLLVSARKQITIVSALDNQDLLAKENPGVQMLSDLMHELGRAAAMRVEADLNPMIADLAIRLTKLGVTTRTNFSTRIKLVASVGEKAAIVEPDWGILGYNLTERYRLRPALLEAMGWMYLRVPSFELFADPEQVARSIALSLGIEVTKKPQPLFELSEPAFEDTSSAWGDSEDSNDQRLAEDKPPHWG